ncbi:MAG: Asp-tRNA(Asn)/Glu-tRNA(Gln) amidotransferase subunit GatC [Chthoniobacterales bacterium]|nr:Asp-tRNA(Asn)/Glu-tRNA(Gln) amidotransferase subunit GatC [Chthoniobacterales bacterium]
MSSHSDLHFDVSYVSKLARIALLPSEINEFQKQLDRVLEHVNQISSLNLENVEPTAHAHPVFNVIRPDEPQAGLPKDQALANAPRQISGLFAVPRVIE